MQIDEYPNIIAPMNITKLNTRFHTLGEFPQYPKDGEPEQWFEEKLASERFKNLIDEAARIFETDKSSFTSMGVMMQVGGYLKEILMVEQPHHRALERLAEKLIRDYYNLSKDEVIFELKLIDLREQQGVEQEGFKTGDCDPVINDPSHTPDFRDELIRRRLTNALIQGAAKKGHYLFHMGAETLEQLMPGIIKTYNEGMILNDLIYYVCDDTTMESMCENESEAGRMEVDFSGPVPKIICESLLFPVLVHECIKGVMEVLTAHGLPKNRTTAQQVIDLSDSVMAEMWDIRLGPKIWEMFHGLIDPDDHDMFKHVMVELSRKSTDDFLQFIEDLFAQPKVVEKEIKRIVNERRALINEYNLQVQSAPPDEDDDDSPPIDFSGLFK